MKADNRSQSVLRPKILFNINLDRSKSKYHRLIPKEPVLKNRTNSIPTKSHQKKLLSPITKLCLTQRSDRVTSRAQKTLRNPLIKESFKKLNNIIPEWLTSREDFQLKYHEMKKFDNKDLGKIVQTPVNLRTEDEKRALYAWVSTKDFFKNLPQMIARELCVCMVYKQYKKGDYVFREGSVPDGFYIIYKGSVGVYKNSDRVAHCDEGACFGDMALDKAVLRSADIICETESIIFKIEESDYKKIIFNFKSLEKHLNYKILTKVPLFSSMSFNKIENIVNSCATATFHSDEIIYEYGCQSHELYIVKNGRVELQIFVDIEKKNKWPIDSHAWNIRKINKVYAVPLKTINVNGCFGEYELINLIPRQTRAVALENTVCLCVNKSEFENFMSFKDSEFISNLNEDFRNSKAQAEKIYKKKILKFKDSNEVLIKTLNYSSKKVERLKESLISRKELEEKEIKKRIIKHSIINTIKNFDHFSNSNSRNI